MKEIVGKYNSAKVFTDVCDDTCSTQIDLNDDDFTFDFI